MRGLFVALMCVVLCGCGPEDAFEARPAEPLVGRSAPEAECEIHEPLGRALFGDLHVHTSVSSDAYAFGVRVTPDDAYRYAFGGELRLPPYEADGSGGRAARIDRPLDFTAVTDHAEFLGESRLCTDPGSEAFETGFCESYREGSGRNPWLVMRIMLPFPWRSSSACGNGDRACAREAAAAWRETIEAAERWNDTTSACERTTFVAYEYSSHRLGSNLHRNVVFRNATVPSLPISYLEARREWHLWERLGETCLAAGNGCDVIAIPHNSNISNGRMFSTDYPGAEDIEAQRARARLRARVEPIVEIMQHKGDSECRVEMPGVEAPADELCGFEKFEDFAMDLEPGETPPGPCSDGWLGDVAPHLGPDCVSPASYVRYALAAGLGEAQRLGVNPFRFGLTASTDTHNGLAGGVRERDFPGHLGLGDDTAAKRVQWSRGVAGNASNNPGGLIGVWAEENSRDAIFAAMKRREVFGTSGPRIRVRFYGSHDFSGDLCDVGDPVEAAALEGVPMGSELPERDDGDGPPSFVSLAIRDAGTPEAPGGLLQRVQIVKGWQDDEGTTHGRVYDVAGNGDNGADVDLDSCTPRGDGYDTLCSTWHDPDWDPDRPAVYYARVVENPSCRYSTWQCLALAPEDRPPDCSDPDRPATIQERAWSSPIWYSP